MKHMIRILAVLGAIILTAACTACQNNSAAPTQAPPSPTEAATQAAETTAVTQAPATEPATAAAETITSTDSDADADKAELVSSKWVLSEVYVNGEKYRGNYYGSIIKQTGAYLEFHEDDTFKCILGFPGCEGTYTVDSGIVTLHITTKYSGSAGDGEPCDETETLVWDHEEGTIRFNFNDVTNVFVKS